jgi:uncharacterized protein (TIGR02172 family)
MLEGASPNEVHTLDFRDVESINFGAMRALLLARKQGLRFNIIHAAPEVAEMFENAGISNFISVCRAAVPIDLSHFIQSGEGFSSITYNSDDGDSMLKFFKESFQADFAEKEKRCSTYALQLGIPTPMAGAVVTAGGRKGLLYERIVNKKSFSRAIADDPDNYEDYARRFARMARQLHSTQCDTALFPNVVDLYKDVISKVDRYDEADKKKFSDFLNSAPVKTTCLHGDMHIGNVITTGGEDLWIDMSDFSYGNPLFDVGMIYVASNVDSEEFNLEYYHLDNAMMLKVWKVFACEYFGVGESELDAVDRMVIPYAVLRTLFFVSCGSALPNNLAFIDKFLKG